MNAVPAETELWKKRLWVPNYGVGEAARYAHTSGQTIRNWQRLGNKRPALGPREPGQALSYLQLIELAVVAAVRKAGVKLPVIRDTREYMSRVLNAEFPFAAYRFKTDGKNLWIDHVGELLEVSGKGQLTWAAIIGRLQEFEYDEQAGLATRWHVAGKRSSVVIDPRIRFGQPSVRGVPTWIIAGRVEAGEEIPSIAKDFGIPKSMVADALAFEGTQTGQAKAWSH